MIRILKNRRALSTVVTTLIILVVSIPTCKRPNLLRDKCCQHKSPRRGSICYKQHIWVDDGGAAVAAIMITNNGGRDVVINKLSVRGQIECTNVFFEAAVQATDDLTADLLHTHPSRSRQ